jgi:hypothetical protein
MAESATLLLFWDYDTQWGGDRSRSPGGPKAWGKLEFENTEQLLDIHARYEIPSCFAVVGAAALPGKHPYHDPAQIRRIHSSGHEVGSHSFRHDWLPGLNRRALKETLSWSKDALEQCIGASIVSFVPPWNEPRDYLRGWSLSLSERRGAPEERTNLRGLCETLYEIGYRFCRVAYRPMHERLIDRLAGRRINRPGRSEKIAGVSCVRLNTPGGFDTGALEMLDRCADEGGFVVAYGHPHSLLSEGPQHKDHLVKFLERASQLKREGRLQLRLPSEITSADE